MELIVHIDGGARGNPGPAGAGIVVAAAAGATLFEAGYCLGEMTNNMAEYHGLLRALEVTAAWPDAELTICSDSELLVRQITGQYRVRNSTLAGLYEQAQTLLLRRDQWHIRHIPREQNRRADELANMAMDAGDDVVVVDQRTARNPSPSDNGATRAEGGAKKPATQPAVIAECKAGSASSICPALCKKGQKFEFQSTTPAGLCLDAFSSMLNTVLALRDAANFSDQPTPPLTVRCFKGDCGAAFELRIQKK